VKEPFHAHRYPSVIYFEGPAHLFEYAPDGTKEDRGVREHGAVRWLPVAPPHALENVDKTQLRAIRVELKKER
jgi:hypothetical protein